GTAFTAFENRGAIAQVEAGHAGGSVAGETLGFEDVAGSLFDRAGLRGKECGHGPQQQGWRDSDTRIPHYVLLGVNHRHYTSPGRSWRSVARRSGEKAAGFRSTFEHVGTKPISGV